MNFLSFHSWANFGYLDSLILYVILCNNDGIQSAVFQILAMINLMFAAKLCLPATLHHSSRVTPTSLLRQIRGKSLNHRECGAHLGPSLAPAAGG